MQTCCPTDQPASGVTGDEQHKGRHVRLESGLALYEVVGSSPQRVIVVAPDIFGIHVPSSLHFLDRLAEAADARVVAVDHFDGRPWKLSDFPPPPGSDLMGWIGSVSDRDKLNAELRQVISYLGSSNCGYLGFCWGGKVAFSLCLEHPCFKAVASAHPSSVTLEMVDSTSDSLPVCLLPSKDEDAATYEKMRLLLESKRDRHHHVYKRYEEAHHGWCQARSKPGDELFERDLADACTVLGDFFKNTL